jgi:hypothetical protein
MLFNQTHDRQRTQLAYRIKYWPTSALSDAAKNLVVWHKPLLLTKQDILDRCNEDKTKFLHGFKEYAIVWAWNNIPTEQEWNKIPAQRNLLIELRLSPAIPEMAVAILSI